MASNHPDRLFDRRTVKRNIRAGLLQRSTYAEFLESLPDMETNLMTAEERAAADAFETTSSPQHSEEDDEADVALGDSTASVLPQFSSSVPAAPAAPEPAPLQPQTAPEPATEPVPVSPSTVQPQTAPETATEPVPVSPSTVQPQTAPETATEPVPVSPSTVQPQTAPETATEPVPVSPSTEPDGRADGDPFADAPLPGQMRVPPAMPAPPSPASSDDREPDGD